MIKHWKFHIYGVVLIFLFSISVVISQPYLEWSKYYNSGSGYDEAFAMAVDSFGNVYVTGVDGETPNGFSTIKYNYSGQLQWHTRYFGGYTITAQPVKIGVDVQGSVYVIANDVNGILIKYSNNGVQQWVRRYQGDHTGTQQFNDMKIMKSGNIVVTGEFVFQISLGDFVTIKYNSSGDSIWVRRFDLRNWTDYPYALALDILGNVAVTGVSYGNYPDSALTVKYDSNGVLQWYRVIDSSSTLGDAITFDKYGNLYITGSIGRNTNNFDWMTIKYDKNGLFKWLKTHDGEGHYNDYGAFIKTDELGNIIVSGIDVGISSFANFCTIKYDSLGNQMWLQRYHGLSTNSDDYVQGLCVDNMNNAYVYGIVFDGTYPDIRAATIIKYTSSGLQQWVNKYYGTDSLANPKDIVMDSSKNIYICGYTGSPSVFFTNKYSQLVGISEKRSIFPNSFKLYQNYPNPFNPNTIISYQLPINCNVSLSIYDVLGREVQKIVNKNQEPGSYKIEWEGTNYASGIYFYKLETIESSSGFNYSETRKMILIK